MVPIHDTDLAEERWSKASWENYELWEKAEGREKRRRQLWITATCVLFLFLSSVPVALDQWPKWMTQHIAGKFAREINRMKRDASIARAPYRIRLSTNGNLSFTVEKLKKCPTSQQKLADEPGELIRTTSLNIGPSNGTYTWISPEQGATLQIPGLVSQFCFDPLVGSNLAEIGKKVAGFGVISVNDLTEKRLDRMSLLLLTGSSAEITFE